MKGAYMNLPPTLLLGAMAALLLGITGCFETNLSLGSGDNAKINPAYCGNWDISDADHPDQKVRLLIRNIDDRHYFVEWENSAEKDEKDKTLRMVGYTVAVK